MLLLLLRERERRRGVHVNARAKAWLLSGSARARTAGSTCTNRAVLARRRQYAATVLGAVVGWLLELRRGLIVPLVFLHLLLVLALCTFAVRNLQQKKTPETRDALSRSVVCSATAADPAYAVAAPAAPVSHPVDEVNARIRKRLAA
jgi:hypothetical protein